MRRRVVAVVSGSAPSKTAQFPAMPKCTWTQTSSASPLPNHANKFLPTASMARKGLLLMAAAPSVKRPFGDVHANFLPTSFWRWRAATRWTEWPSTILIGVLRGVGRQAAARTASRARMFTTVASRRTSNRSVAHAEGGGVTYGSLSATLCSVGAARCEN